MYALVSRTGPWHQLRAVCQGLTPEQTASHVVSSFGLVSPPVDVTRIAAALRVPVQPVAGVSWAGAVNSSGSSAMIWVRATDSEVRKRFTVAHELGHLLLHPLGTAFRDHTFSGGWRETEANRFAAALLMPEAMVRGLWMQVQDCGRLADFFDVSFTAMSIRLEVLLGIPAQSWG